MRRVRSGFTLLEVMLSVGILAFALLILLETQGTAILMTEEADRIMVATQLANEKMSEVRMLVEREGFQVDDVHEEGEFDDFGDEAVNLEFEQLDDYHWEYLVTEVDLALAGDLSSGVGNAASSVGGDAAGLGAAMPDMSSLGLGEDQISEMLQPFLREVKIRVWWGDDLDEAEELGNEVVLTTHVSSPRPSIGNLLPGGGGGGGGGGGRGPAAGGGGGGGGRGAAGRGAAGAGRGVGAGRVGASRPIPRGGR